MMLPILISVSVAPVSYFFWASALPPVAAKARTAVANAAVRSLAVSIVSPSSFLILPEPSDQVLGNDRHLPCAVRHQEDDEEQKYAEHRAGEALGNAFCDVGHEDDEGGTDQRSRQPTDAADHHAEKQIDREHDGVGVRCDELHGDGAESAGNPGDAGADAECQRLVERDV